MKIGGGLLDLGELEWTDLGPDWGDMEGYVQALSWGDGPHEGIATHMFHAPSREELLAWLEGPCGEAYATGWHQRTVFGMRRGEIPSTWEPVPGYPEFRKQVEGA